MTYKEYLDLIKGKDISPYKLLSAVEMECYLYLVDKSLYNDEDFEFMCELVYEYFMEQDDDISTPTTIAYELKEILFEDRLYNVKDIELYWYDIKEEIKKRLR